MEEKFENFLDRQQAFMHKKLSNHYNKVIEVSNEVDQDCTFEPQINTTSMILAEM